MPFGSWHTMIQDDTWDPIKWSSNNTYQGSSWWSRQIMLNIIVLANLINWLKYIFVILQFSSVCKSFSFSLFHGKQIKSDWHELINDYSIQVGRYVGNHAAFITSVAGYVVVKVWWYMAHAFW